MLCKSCQVINTTPLLLKQSVVDSELLPLTRQGNLVFSHPGKSNLNQKMGQIRFFSDKISVHFGAPLIWKVPKSPKYVPFGTSLIYSGPKSDICDPVSHRTVVNSWVHLTASKVLAQFSTEWNIFVRMAPNGTLIWLCRLIISLFWTPELIWPTFDSV